MAGQPSHYTRGEMDIHEQQRTFHSFLVLGKWSSLIMAAGILFFSLLFAVGTGFIGASATTVVVMVLGVIALREKKKAPH